MYRDFQKLRLFFGVEWIFCESKEVLNQEMAEARRQGRKFMHRTDGSRYWMGLLPEGDVLDGGRINLPAAVVAAQLSDVIIQLDLADDKGWVCVISEGQPVSDYDKVVSRDESIRLAFEAAKVYMQAQICSASIEGSVRTFDAFLDSASQLKADYQGQMFPTPVFTKGRIKVAAALLLMIGLAYGGYVGFDIYQEKQRQAEQEAAERIRQNNLTAEEMERLASARRVQLEAFQQRVQAAKVAFEEANGAAGAELYAAWRNVITNMPTSIIPFALKRDIQCQPDSCVGTWMVSGGKMLDRLGLETAGARLSDGDGTVEAVVGASIIESEYALPDIAPRPMGHAEYPKTALAMVDDLKHMGEVHFPMPVQPVIIEGVPDMQIPDEVIGRRQPIVITTSGPFALQRVGDILEKSTGISVNWDLLRVEFESQFAIRQIQLQGSILFKPEN
jgi:hypothetical protein